MKNKETLEELAERIGDMFDYEPEFKAGVIYGVIAGAKLQQDKNKYSEEDMQEYAEFCIRCYNEGLPCIVAKDWVKQFKKK
jgi:hypothetical protein